jgi:hypothetical protein
MNRLFVIFLVVLWGCSQESAVDSAKSSTFVRYFNGSFEDEAQALLETADKGLIIMANTNFDGFNRVNLIKTDEFGNLLWQKFYPETVSTTISYSGYGISLTPSGGYVIVGETIQGNTTKLPAKLLIITTDAEGNTPVIKTMDNLSTRKGISVAVNPAGNFLIVSSIPNQPSTNLILSEFDKSKLDTTWTRQYGAGSLVDNNLPNRLFIDGSGNAYWGGTVKKDNVRNSMRFIKTPPNSQKVLFDITLGKATDTETSGDMIRYGSGFAFVGTSTLADNTTNIVVRRASEGGTEIFSQSYKPELLSSKDPLTGAIAGNSLCVAQDGGLVLLGTVGTTTSNNFCLLKIDGFGSATPTWTKVFGGRFDDEGKVIITTSDGGHVILGTTNLANVKTLLLMKVDKDGNIPGL